MQTWKTGLAALVTAAALLSGCGGSDDDDSADASASLDAEVDTDGELSGDCEDAFEAMAATAGGLTDAFSGEVESLEEAVEAMEDYADDAPDEIRDDFQLVASAYAEVVEVMVENDIDLSGGEIPDEDTMAALEEATSDLDDEELSAAADRIQAYFEEECGIEAGPEG